MDDWDAAATTFDDEPDHGLRDPAVRRTWAELLLPLLPTAPARVADLGCGTGSLSVLLAQAGHHVHGIDASPRMIEVARAKADGLAITFGVADAADPPLGEGSVDVVLVRHLLWVFPDPDAVVARWVSLVKPGGRLVLVEGHWSTGAGIPAESCRDLVARHLDDVEVRFLDDPGLWGKEISDERYLVTGRL